MNAANNSSWLTVLVMGMSLLIFGPDADLSIIVGGGCAALAILNLRDSL